MPWESTSGSGITTLENNVAYSGGGANGKTTFGPFTFSAGTSYIVRVSAANAATVNDAINVELTFADNLGNFIDVVSHWFLGANSALEHIVQMTGPAVGTQMFVTVNGWYAANSPSGHISVFQDGLTQRQFHRGRSLLRSGTKTSGSQQNNAINCVPSVPQSPTFPGTGFALPFADPTGQMLFQAIASFSATSNQQWLLPYYNGPVSVMGQTNSLTSDMGVNFFDASHQNSYSAAPISAPVVWGDNSAGAGAVGAGTIQRTFYMPNVQCNTFIFNNNAAAKTLGLIVNMAD